ncbi:MAG: hypothetical protein AAFX99_36830 [Myxococcota bacterium]
MNVWYALAGAGALGVMAIHLVEGGRTVLKPMREAQFDPLAQATLVVCWHTITALLTLMGLGLLACAYTPESSWVMPIVLAVTLLNAIFAVLFLGFGAALGRVWELGQWMLFVPLVVLGLVGVW